jgi:hypothetical protein
MMQSLASDKTIPDKIFDFNRLACLPPAQEEVKIIGVSLAFLEIFEPKISNKEMQHNPRKQTK